MTRDEAIEQLKQIPIHDAVSNDYMKSIYEAIDMAIKTLEQERSRSAEITQYRHDCEKLMEENERLKKALEQEPCKDAISRQVVLDLIEHYNSDGLGAVFYGYEQGVKFADAVNKLPSVTPQQRTGRWEQTRYRSIDQTGETYDDGIGFRCSNCANVFKVTSLIRYHFCPNCGAEMEVEE